MQTRWWLFLIVLFLAGQDRVKGQDVPGQISGAGGPHPPSWLSVAKCRVACIEEFLTPPYSDIKCNSSTSCNVCWILCELLIQQPYCEGEAIRPCCLNLCHSLFQDTRYSKESRHLCIAGCHQACVTVNTRNIHSVREETGFSPSAMRKWRFSVEPTFQPISGNEMNISWQTPTPPVGHVSSPFRVPLLYILLWQTHHPIMSTETWWIGDPYGAGEVMLVAVGRHGILAGITLHIPTTEPPSTYSHTVAAALRSQVPVHTQPDPGGTMNHGTPFYSPLHGDNDSNGGSEHKNTNIYNGSGTNGHDIHLNQNTAHPTPQTVVVSRPEVKLTNGSLHALVTWQPRGPLKGKEHLYLHWAREDCQVDKEFPKCDEPIEQYSMSISSTNNGSQELIPHPLTYNSKYWVEVTGSHRTYFITPGCHNPDPTFTKCLSTALISGNGTDGRSWYLNVTCINYDVNKDVVAVLLQWSRPVRSPQRLTYHLKYWAVAMEPAASIRGNTTVTNKTFHRMELQPDSRFVFMVSTDVESDVEGLSYTENSQRLVVNTSLKDIPQPINSSGSALTCDYVHTGKTGALVQESSPSLESYLAISLYFVVGAFFLLAMLFLAYKKCRSFRQIIITKAAIAKSNSYKSTPGSSGDTVQQQLMSLQDEWELDPAQLKMGTELGQGAFGRVLTGHYQDKKVAIKMLKENVPLSYREDLLCEIGLMKKLGHHNNIVSLVGACTLTEPIALVMEYVPHGNLQVFLKQCRLEGDLQKTVSGQELVYTMLTDTSTDVWTISPTDILSFARQIALAMEYLAHKQYVHRDLAARNVLVAEDKVVKVCDFGLSRVMYNGEEYHKLSNGKLPLKWMALESLTDRVFTSHSDVWSFGILLWEIVTMGASPYPNVALADLYGLLSSGYRMDKPNNCSPELYTLMCQCWREDPRERPSFTWLRSRLEDLLTQNCDYLELDNIDVPVQPSDSSSLSLSVFSNQPFQLPTQEEVESGQTSGPNVRPRPDIIDFTTLNPVRCQGTNNKRVVDTCLNSPRLNESGSNEQLAGTSKNQELSETFPTMETELAAHCVCPPDVVTQAPDVPRRCSSTEAKKSKAENTDIGYCTLAVERTDCAKNVPLPESRL